MDSSQRELSVVCQQIFSISYGFRNNKGQRCKQCYLVEYCVKHIRESKTLLCQAYYSVKNITVSYIILQTSFPTFTFRHAAVVSCCACEAPQFSNVLIDKELIFNITMVNSRIKILSNLRKFLLTIGCMDSINNPKATFPLVLSAL